jgi:glucose/arabinose dehydrogenase
MNVDRRAFLACVGSVAVAGCVAPRSAEPVDDLASDDRDSGGESSWRAPTTAPGGSLDSTVLVENLEVPWDISFAGDGTVFVSERVGRVLAYDGDQARTVAEPADVIDAGSVEPGAEEGGWWVDGGEGGLLGVAAHPEYPDPAAVYAYYTTDTGLGKTNKVVAFDAGAPDPAATMRTIVDDIPASNIHNGGRLEFGPRNNLWVTCGDAGTPENAQDLDSLAGTVLRVTPDGDPAPDNPDHGGDPRVYTYGHRNPQGVVWLPDGTVVCTEHGPRGRDEFNRLVPGGNYGWPDVRKREEYHDDVRRPLANSGSASWAPSGAVFYTGDVSTLRNRLLVGGLISQELLVATLTPAGEEPPAAGSATHYDHSWTDDAYTATVHSRLTDRLGRIRHVEQGPDGGLYAVTSNRDGRADGKFPTERDDVLVRIT